MELVLICLAKFLQFVLFSQDEKKEKRERKKKRHLEVGKQASRQYAFYSSLSLGMWSTGFHSS